MSCNKFHFTKTGHVHCSRPNLDQNINVKQLHKPPVKSCKKLLLINNVSLSYVTVFFSILDGNVRGYFFFFGLFIKLCAPDAAAVLTKAEIEKRIRRACFSFTGVSEEVMALLMLLSWKQKKMMSVIEHPQYSSTQQSVVGLRMCVTKHAQDSDNKCPFLWYVALFEHVFKVFAHIYAVKNGTWDGQGKNKEHLHFTIHVVH